MLSYPAVISARILVKFLFAVRCLIRSFRQPKPEHLIWPHAFRNLYLKRTVFVYWKILNQMPFTFMQPRCDHPKTQRGNVPGTLSTPNSVRKASFNAYKIQVNKPAHLYIAEEPCLLRLRFFSIHLKKLLYALHPINKAGAPTKQTNTKNYLPNPCVIQVIFRDECANGPPLILWVFNECLDF